MVPVAQKDPRENTGERDAKKQAKAQERAKARRQERQVALDDVADAFFASLVTSRARLKGVKTVPQFAEELTCWRQREKADGRVRRGGPMPVLRRLKNKGLADFDSERRVTWTKKAVSRTPAEPKAATKKTKNPKKTVRKLADTVASNQELVEKNKGGIEVGQLDLDGFVAQPNAYLVRSLTITNAGDKTRQLREVIVVDNEPSPYRASFEVGTSRMLPLALAPGDTVTVTVTCKMPQHPGCTKGLLNFNLNTFAIGRFMTVTCGNAAVIADLQPTTKYKRMRKRNRRSKNELVKPVPSGMGRFPVELENYKPPESWRQAVVLGEADEQLETAEDLAPLSAATYAERFRRLLWCEEDAQKENLAQFDIDDTSMRATAAHLTLRVEGLAEKRPSVLRGDYVDVEWNRRDYRGRVMIVERDRILMQFQGPFHAQHKDTNRYNVRFVYRRVPMCLSHQGLKNLHSLPTSLLFPSAAAAAACPPPMPVSYFNTALNTHQRIAVQHVQAGAGVGAPYLLYGPPGTGKTTTVVEMVGQAVRSGRRVLVMAPTNAAADTICERLHQTPGSPCGSSLAADGKMLRVMAFSRALDTVPKDVLPHCTVLGDGFRTPSGEELNNASVVVGTLATAAKLYNLFKELHHFNVAFIDEAGQALEPECIAPLATLMTPRCQVVLAGDHQQLGPIVLSPTARRQGLELSFLERLSRLPLYRRQEGSELADSAGYNPKAITMLTENYRSHAEIIEVPNRLFYHSELKARGDRRKTHCLSHWNGLPAPGVPMVFHHLVGNNMREAQSPSWFNPEEAAQVLNYVQLLLGLPGIQPEDIGIIAPYHKQVQKIKKALKNAGIETAQDGLKVGSTEMFQGQERRIIIISTVRSDESFLELDQAHNLGFVANAKRFNVAVTRAEALLIVVGNAKVVAVDENWEALLAHCKARGAWAGESVALPSDPPAAQPEEPTLYDAIVELASRFALLLDAP